MQIRTLSHSIKIKLSELRKLMEPYGAYFHPYKLPGILISPTVDDDRLAYFDSSSNSIVFQEDFIMGSDAHSEKNVLLHELAHALQYSYGNEMDHGPSFRKYCEMLGCDPAFSRAKVNATKEKRESYARKVEKLLALSSSPYEEESKAALLKAEEMMAAHGLEYAFKHRDEDKLYYVPLAVQGRFMLSSKKLFQLVANLTGGFLLYEDTESSKLRQACIYGSLEQVETAIYLHSYFSSALERSVRDERRRKKSEGLGFSAESYKVGLVTGLTLKMQQENADAARALTLSSERNREIYLDITGTRLRFVRTYLNPNSILDYGSGMEASRNIGIPRSDERIKGRKLIES